MYWKDIFVRDRLLGETTIVSVSSFGEHGNWDSSWPSITADGRYVAFESKAYNLVPGDTFLPDVFVHDRQTGETRKASVSWGGAAGDSSSFQPAFRADGAEIAFTSASTNLVAGDANGAQDIFVRTEPTACEPITGYCTGKSSFLGCAPAISHAALPSLSGPDTFFVTATQVLSGKLGVFYWSLAPAAIPFWNGTLCVAPPVVRTPEQFSAAAPAQDCYGLYSFRFSHGYMASRGIGAGTAVYGQYWMRDGPNQAAMTPGLRFVVCP
jgi:hypothetical protein